MSVAAISTPFFTPPPQPRPIDTWGAPDGCPALTPEPCLTATKPGGGRASTGGRVHETRTGVAHRCIARTDSRRQRARNIRTAAAQANATPPAYRKGVMPSDVPTLRRIRDYCVMAVYPYYRNRQLPAGWSVAAERMASLASSINATVAIADGADAVISQPHSALAAVLLRNDAKREFVLAFGGTTSGKAVHASPLARMAPGFNFKSTLRQWRANMAAGMGILPDSYLHAAQLTRALQDQISADPSLAGYTVHLTGHSKGGGEAMYAALATPGELRATVFSPAHLSRGLLGMLPAASLADAHERIASYSPYGDPVPALRGWAPYIDGIGTGFHFHGVPGSGRIDLHDDPVRHLDFHIRACRIAQLAMTPLLAA